MSVSTSIPIEGVLNCWNDEHDLPDLLLSISRSGRTGRLLFSNPEADKTLFVKEGKIVYAESSSEDDGLGQHLLRAGQISLMDYVRVSRRVEKGRRLGALLVDEGVLEPKELVPSVVGQVRAIILGLFRRTETWYRFKDEELPGKETITLDMPVSQLVIDGVQYVESWRRVSKGVGSLDAVYRRRTDSASDWGRLDLNDGVSELLDMLKQPVSVDHICTHASLPDFDACRYLWAFRCLGWIERVEAPQAVAVPSATPPDAAHVVTVPAMPSEPEPEPENAPVEPVLTESEPAALPPAAPDRQAAPAIAQHLIETRVSVSPAESAPSPPPSTPASPPPATPPRPSIEALAQTQLAVNTESASEPPVEATTSPESASSATPRRSIPDELVHTQLFDAGSGDEDASAPEGPSTSEMMEAILEGGEPSGTPRPTSTPRPKPKTAPSPAAAAATTQYFEGASAIEPPAATPEPPAPSTPDEVPYGFEALALEDVAAPPSTAPVTRPSLPLSPSPSPEVASMPSFDELAYAPEPPVEASIVEVVEGEDPDLPVVEPEAVVEVAPEAKPTEGGREPLASPDPDPFASHTGSGFSFDELSFESHDPVTAPDPPPPKPEHADPTPSADEVDFDMDGLGHLLGSDGTN
jgi:hypothetical protein